MPQGRGHWACVGLPPRTVSVNLESTMERAETGSSLAGLLLVVMILGVMAVVAMAGTSLLLPGGVGLPAATLPASPTTAASTSGASRQITAVGLARQAACQADYEGVVTADAAMFTKTGSYADTIEQLVAAGYLQAAPTASGGFTIGLSYAPRVQGLGPDRGAGGGGQDPTGGVTVNGVAGPTGCDGL